MAANKSVICLQTLSRSLDTVTQSLSGHKTQMLLHLCTNVSTALVASQVSTSTLLDWQSATQGVRESLAAKVVMQAHCHSISSYTAFVQAALAWMHVIAPDPDSHHTSEATKPVFDILFTPMAMFTNLPSTWPTCRYLLRNPQLYNALNALAAYFLSRKRKINPARGVTVTPLHVMTSALRLLRATAVCLKPVSSTVDHTVLAALPSGFTNNIFCLACEELGVYMKDQESVVARRGHWTELSLLLSLVMTCVEEAKEAISTGYHQQLCKSLLGPGALEAGRMIKIAYCSAALQNENGASRAASDVNNLLSWCGGLSFLHRSPEQSFESQTTTHPKHASGHDGTRGCNNHSAGSLASGSSSRHPTDPLIPRVKVTDVQLMAALRQQSSHTPATLVENTKLMYFLWMCTGVVRGRSEDPFNQSGNAQFSMGTAHHCTFNVLLWMREQQVRQAEQSHRQLGKGSRHDSTHIPSCSSVSIPMETKLGIFDLRCLMTCSSTAWQRHTDPGVWQGCF